MSAPPAYELKNNEMMNTSGGNGAQQSYPLPGVQPAPMHYQVAPQHYQVAPQPQVAQQNIIVVQQQGSNTNSQELRGWNSGLCACCDDCEGCCLTLLCPQCMMCRLASKLGESACCVGFCCEQFGSLSHMRVKLRTLYGIRGDICDDICTRLYYPQLVMCQMDRELKHLGL